MKKTNIGASTHQIGNLFTFALVALFAILALFLAVVGIEDYQSVLEVTDRNNDMRVSFGYIANKIRTSDGEGNVEISDIEGHSALILRHSDGGDEYHTCIYYYDGMLREQPYDPSDEEFMLEDGEGIIEVETFEIDMAPEGLVQIMVTTRDGRAHSMRIAVRSLASLGRTGL